MPPPKQIFSAFKNKASFKYGPIQGNLSLRESLSKQHEDSNAGNFVITNGASEALDLALRSIRRPHGKILIPVPYYYTYPHLIKLNGMTPVFTKTSAGKIDLEDFNDKVRDCAAVLINSPSNPTGIVQEIKTLREIEKTCADLGKVLISDEVYSSLVYEKKHYSVKGSNVITIQSFSKTYSMCGYRVGYIFSKNEDITKKAVEIKTCTSMNTSTIAQEMAYEALKVPKQFIAKHLDIWRKRRNTMYNGLLNLGLDVWNPEGAFYVLPKIKNPEKSVWELYKKHKVITYLGEWFGAPKRIRLSYALNIDKVEEGLKRIRKYLEQK